MTRRARQRLLLGGVVLMHGIRSDRRKNVGVALELERLRAEPDFETIVAAIPAAGATR